MAKQKGMTFQVHSWEMKAGEGLVFEPGSRCPENFPTYTRHPVEKVTLPISIKIADLLPGVVLGIEKRLTF